MDMQKAANKFQTENKGKGKVTKVTDYSFEFEQFPKDLLAPKENTKTVIYYESYFTEV